MVRKIWFQLVDAGTRAPYAGVRKASVSTDGVSDVDDLCDAIREKFREDVLKGVGASQLRVYANRAAYDAKNARRLGWDSSLGSLGEEMRNALIVVVKERAARGKSLRLTAQDSYPRFLKKAIEIANVMLAQAQIDFEKVLGADKTTRKHLRGVKVEFQRIDPPCYGWTDRSSIAKVIFVNKVLRDRVDLVDFQVENPHEYQCIFFVVAATIYHECAHLTLRWKGILDSPTKFGSDVGNYMEAILFKGICCLKIQQSTHDVPRKSRMTKWTKKMPILDVVIEIKGESVVRPEHLNKFFTEGDLHKKMLFPLDRKAYKETKGAVVLRGADQGPSRKRRRIPLEENPNFMIPPLCGIARRKLSM